MEIEEEDEAEDDESIEMRKIMGFSKFDTTKGKFTTGASNASYVNVTKPRKYRQYMNRRGGFNRPLDYVN